MLRKSGKNLYCNYYSNNIPTRITEHPIHPNTRDTGTLEHWNTGTPEHWNTRTPEHLSDKPVFFGHYWLKDTPVLQRSNICCLDYSVAKGGKLVGYRVGKEGVLNSEGFRGI